MSTGMAVAIIGLYFIANTILSSSYDSMSIWYGILFGMGLANFIAGGAFYNYEKQLDAKTKS